MSLSLSLTPGYLFQDDDILTPAILRLIAQPTILLNGTIGAASLADGSVTTAKLADGALSADTLGEGKMADGYLLVTKIATGTFTADSTGRLPFASGWLNQTLMDDTTRLDAAGYAAGTTTVTAGPPATGAIAATLGTAPGGYFAGMTVKILLDVTNPGATTLNLNALGAKNILKNVSQALAPGDLVLGDIATLIYDGTQFQLQRRGAAAIIASTRNLIIKPNTGAPNNKADAAADEILLKDANGNPFVAAAVAVTVDVTASGVNGLDTGAEAANTWYYLWVIYNGTTVASLLSLSATAPTLPAGYTFKALAGVVQNNGSSNFTPFRQSDRTVWVDTVNAHGGGDTVYTSVSLASFVPPLAKSVFGTAGVTTNSNGAISLAGDANGLGAVILSVTGSIAQDSFFGSAGYEVPCATAQTLYFKTDTNVTRYQINVSGYRI